MSELREALEKAGLPSEAAWETFIAGPIDGRVLRCYAIDVEAIARVWVERRIATARDFNGYLEILPGSVGSSRRETLLAFLFPSGGAPPDKETGDG